MPRTTPDWEPEKNFIGFLDETGLLGPDSESADMLVDHLGAIEKQFRHNMADASRYSFGKRLWTTATAEGVRLDDRASVESFMADFNALSQAPQAPALMSGPDQGATGSSHRGRGARVRSGARAGGTQRPCGAEPAAWCSRQNMHDDAFPLYVRSRPGKAVGTEQPGPCQGQTPTAASPQGARLWIR
jgi:hypothetical protein